MVEGAQSDPQTVLQQLRQKNPDVTGAVLATTDGFAVHSDVAPDVDADTLAATATDLCVRAAGVAENLEYGSANEIMVAADGGYVIAGQASEELFLAVSAKSDASLGLLIINVRKAAAQLG